MIDGQSIPCCFLFFVSGRRELYGMPNASLARSYDDTLTDVLRIPVSCIWTVSGS